MNHVVIIGFMGSGKTRVGKQLSKDLGLSFVDLERLITRKMNMSAREIFQRFGEPYYRALETVALKQLIQDNERRVISLGAGLPPGRFFMDLCRCGKREYGGIPSARIER